MLILWVLLRGRWITSFTTTSFFIFWCLFYSLVSNDSQYFEWWLCTVLINHRDHIYLYSSFQPNHRPSDLNADTLSLIASFIVHPLLSNHISSILFFLSSNHFPLFLPSPPPILLPSSPFLFLFSPMSSPFTDYSSPKIQLSFWLFPRSPQEFRNNRDSHRLIPPNRRTFKRAMFLLIHFYCFFSILFAISIPKDV